MEINLYIFSKRHNSMAIPAPGDAHTALCRINDGRSSILAPAVRIAGYPENHPLHPPGLFQHNYAYIPDFRRYYFITNWVYNGDNTWTASCEVDVLATYADNIRHSPCYVERAEDLDMLNESVADRFYPASIEYETAHSYAALSGWSSDPANGSFIIGIITNVSPTYGSVKYYLMNAAQMTQLLTNLMSTMGGTVTDWTANTDIVTKALKSVINPIQYIVSVKWFPFTVTVTGSLEDVWLGNWNSAVQAQPVLPADTNTNQTVSVAIPAFPELPIEDELKRPPYSPYRVVSMYSKIFGMLDLPPQSLMGYGFNAILVNLQINVITGNATITFTPYNNSHITPYYGDVILYRQISLAQSVPITQVATDYIGIAKSAADTTAAVASSWTNPVAAAAKGFSGLLDATELALSPSVSSTAFSVAAFDTDIANIHCVIRQYVTVEHDPHEWGFPVYRKYSVGLGSQVPPGPLNGKVDKYVKCNDFHLVSHTDDFNFITQPEREQIENMMDGGVYYY